MSRRIFSSATYPTDEEPLFGGDEPAEDEEFQPPSKRGRTQPPPPPEDDIVMSEELGGGASQSGRRFSASQNTRKERREEDEEEFSASQIRSSFRQILKEGGVKFYVSQYYVEDPVKLRKHVEKQVGNSSQAIQEFTTGFKQHISKPEAFKNSLMPMESSENTITESLCRILMTVPALQYNIAVDLLELIPTVQAEFGSEENMVRLILTQFRWIDFQKGSKITDKILEILSNCESDIQKEIISFIPEIIDDSQHKDMVSRLKELMQSQSELLTCVLDSLSNLNFEEEVLKELMGFVVTNMSAVPLEDLAIIVRFLLQSSTETSATQVVTDLREHLDLSSFVLQNDEEEEIDFAEISRKTQGKNKKGKQEREKKNAASLILDALRSGLRFKKTLEKAFIKSILSSIQPGDQKMFDIWVLIVIHSMEMCRKDAEKVLKKKIKEGLYKIDLMKRSIEGQADSFSQFFSTLSAIAGFLMRASDQSLYEFGGAMYQLMYDIFTVDHQRQEILGALVTHLGSGNKFEIDTALDVLLYIARAHTFSVRGFSGFIQGMLDYLDGLSEMQLRKLYEMFSIIALLRIPEDLTTQTKSTIKDELFIIMKKQLSNGSLKYKKMGIIACTMMISYLGCVSESLSMLSQAEQELSEEEFLTFLEQLYSFAVKECEKIPISLSFLFDEISAAIESKNMDMKIIKHLDKEIIRHVSGLLQEVEAGEKLKPLENSEGFDNIQPELWMDMAQTNKQGGSALKLVETVASESHTDYENLLNCIPTLRLIAVCENRLKRRSNETVTKMLIEAPLILFQEEKIPVRVSGKESNLICTSLFTAINWFREIVNTYSSIKDEELRKSIVQRLYHLIELEKKLDKILFHNPTYAIPQANQTLAGIEAKVPTIKKPKKVAPKKKKATKKKAKEDEADPGSEEEEADAENLDEEAVSSKSDYSFSVDMKSLARLRPFMRELRLSTLNILENENMTKNYPCIFYISQDLLWKIDTVIARQKRSFFASAAAPKIAAFDLTQIKTERFFNKLKAVFAHIVKVIEDAHQDMVQEDNDDAADELNPDIHRFRKPSLKAAILIVKKVFTFLGADPSKLKEFLIKDEQEDESFWTELFSLFKNFITSEYVASFEDVANLFDVLNVVAKASELTDLQQQLGEVAANIMRRQFSKVKGDTLCKIMLCQIKNAVNPMDVMKKYVEEYIPEFLGQVSVSPEDLFMLDKSKYVYFFRTLITEAISMLESVTLKTKDEDIIKTNITNVCNSVEIFVPLIEQTRKHLTLPSIVREMLKLGKEYMKQIKRVTNFLGIHLKTRKQTIFRVFERLMSATDNLQAVCAEVKINKNKTITSLIPYVKKFIEEYIYKVKEILRKNDMMDAFELSKSKQTELKLESASEDDANDSYDDEIVEKPKKTATKKKTTKKAPAKKASESKEDEESSKPTKAKPAAKAKATSSKAKEKTSKTPKKTAAETSDMELGEEQHEEETHKKPPTPPPKKPTQKAAPEKPKEKPKEKVIEKTTQKKPQREPEEKEVEEEEEEIELVPSKPSSKATSQKAKTVPSKAKPTKSRRDEEDEDEEEEEEEDPGSEEERRPKRRPSRKPSRDEEEEHEEEDDYSDLDGFIDYANGEEGPEDDDSPNASEAEEVPDEEAEAEEERALMEIRRKRRLKSNKRSVASDDDEEQEYSFE